MKQLRMVVFLIFLFSLFFSGISKEKSDLFTKIEDIKSNIEKMEILRDKFVRSVKIIKGEGALEITVYNVTKGVNLKLWCIRKGNMWKYATAVMWDWSPFNCRVDADKLLMGDFKISGEVKVYGVVWSDKRKIDLERGNVIEISFNLELVSKDGINFDGSAILLNPFDAPFENIPLVAKGCWMECSIPVFEKMKSIRPKDFLDEIVQYERYACEIYKDIISCVIQREYGIPFKLARMFIVDYVIDRSVCREKGIEIVEESDEDMPSSSEELKQRTVKNKEKEETAIDLDIELGPDIDTLLKEADGAVKHISEIVSVVERAVVETNMLSYQIGDAEIIDEEFGPWCTSIPLPESEAGITIPKPDGRWYHVPRWKVAGIFPLSPLLKRTVCLPDFIPAVDTLVKIDPAQFPRRFCEGPYSGPNPRQWEEVKANPRTGYVEPPVYMKFGGYDVKGHDWCAFYAVTEVYSDKEDEMWSAMIMSDTGALWVNHILVWESGEDRMGTGFNVWRFKIKFKKGKNLLMVRFTNSQRPVYFVLKIYPGGEPRQEIVYKKEIADRNTGYSRVESPCKGLSQWRKDHSGRFTCKVPVVWDFEKKINIKWVVPLKWCNGAVITVGDKVITQEEPFYLICLSREDGKVLWRISLDPLKVVAPYNVDKAEQLIKSWQEADEKEKEKVVKELNDFYRKTLGLNYVPEEEHYTGNAMSTPISDGKHIWVKVGSLALACVTMKGEIVWMVSLGASGGGMCHPISSPVLVGNKIVCQVPVYPKPGVDLSSYRKAYEDEIGESDPRHANRRQVLKCFNALTGEILWTSRMFRVVHFGNRYDADGAPTPHVMRLTDGDRIMDVIFMGGGQVFRLEDGELVLPYAGIFSSVATPVDDGKGRLWVFMEDYSGHSGPFGRVTAANFIMHGYDRVECIINWSTTLQRNYYGGFVVDDNSHLFAFDGKHLWTIDTNNGRVLSITDEIFCFEPGNPYPPPSLIGGFLYLFDDGRNDYNKYTAWINSQKQEKDRIPLMPGCGSVILPADTPVVLARNYGLVNDGLTISPFADNGELFLRFRRSVACIAYNPEGQKYEKYIIAKTIINQLPATDLIDGAVVEPAAVSDIPYGYLPPRLAVGKIMADFYIIGPYKKSRAEELEKSIGFPLKAEWIGKSRKLFNGAVVREVTSDSIVKYSTDKRFTIKDWRLGLFYDLNIIHSNMIDSVCYWAGIFTVPKSVILRLEMPYKEAEMWIGGEKVTHNTRILLKRGLYLISLKTQLDDRILGEVPFRIRLWPADNLEEEKELRSKKIKIVSSFLKHAVEEFPDSDVALFVKSMNESISR